MFLRIRSHYQQLTEFERGRIVGLLEGELSLPDIAERLCINVSNLHDSREQWSSDASASRPGFMWSCSSTEREDHSIRLMAGAHHTASVVEILAAVGAIVKQPVRSRLLHKQLQAKHPLACIPLTSSHCRWSRQ
ncbi:HTH_Tnp_Tc3_2 domain-containing protein [Trichonephila clavipes]|nr:HTH_Tnp_Tc3_2 domain-containing protein [Trichonephila clavipes]